MQLINNITNDASQKIAVLFDGTAKKIVLELVYRPTQTGWFLDVTYEDFILRGIRVCISKNLLSQWQNQIPFGLLVVSADGQEPFFVEDFITDRVKIAVLNKEEVEAIDD